MASRVASKTGSKPSMLRTPRSQTSAAKAKPPEQEKESKFELPALSVPFKPKTTTEAELKKMKQRMMRRHAPPGECIKGIKTVLQSLKKKEVTVQEFIGLVAPYTADSGAVLRSVMNDDLNSFRKLARKVYETITQDNSDVLLNQQLQLAEYYREKKALLHDKMMRQIEEIYMMAPNFDFDRYAAEKEKYLKELFPIPDELQVEPEEIEMMKRQAAYHRLQWLRSEGERLNEENNRLKTRLQQLKQMHKEEQRKMMEAELEAEAKKEALEAEQAAKVETLEQLNESLEKTIISKETTIREKTDQSALSAPHPSKVQKKKTKAAVRKKRPAWNEVAAYEMEVEAAEAAQVTEAAAEMEREQSFHYTPTRETRPQVVQYGRRGAARPKDTWGGFY
ncbi:serine/threonine-protein kinase dst2 [Tribolium castaneum]|uniref:Uncharacterized protein n=1 Tax=Tribolium castaneum TaxID=7070 RepID=D6WVF9_TRICA|nr:PREDICTED: serine/threonine-protein kinase dst2 [Tribolium castaneum]EFA08305.1 hypothetical protein TcasGA2_TC005941 [Tribolium castaneum]|eukprot:XP_008196478.1 PREDICTED: serine/threonine-protein kinase dst2 [Tribolium castaneum]